MKMINRINRLQNDLDSIYKDLEFSGLNGRLTDCFFDIDNLLQSLESVKVHIDEKPTFFRKTMKRLSTLTVSELLVNAILWLATITNSDR